MRQRIAGLTEDEADYCITELSRLLSPAENTYVPALQNSIRQYMREHMPAKYSYCSPEGELNVKRYFVWILGAYSDARQYMSDADAAKIMQHLATSKLVRTQTNALESIVRGFDCMTRRVTKNIKTFKPDPKVFQDAKDAEQLHHITPESFYSVMADAGAFSGQRTTAGNNIPGVKNYDAGGKIHHHTSGWADSAPNAPSREE